MSNISKYSIVDQMMSTLKKIEQLSNHLKYKMEQVEDETSKMLLADVSFNDCGEVQGLGSQLDVEISKFCTLQKLSKELKD